MDNLVSNFQESRAAKKAKSKKKKKNTINKPIKVVYISNPRKVTASASEFRALVQELTGQYAELPDPTKFTADTDEDTCSGGNQTVPDAAKNSADNHEQEVPRVEEQPAACYHKHEQQRSTRAHDHDVLYDDEVFTPQMLDNFTGFLSSGLL